MAADHLGLSLSSGQVEYVLSRLYNDRTNRGLLVGRDLKRLQGCVDRCRYAASDFFAELWEWKSTAAPPNGRVGAPLSATNSLSPELLELARGLKQAGDAITAETERQDFTAAHDRLVALAGELNAWHGQQVAGSVYWIESAWNRRGTPRMTLAESRAKFG